MSTSRRSGSSGKGGDSPLAGCLAYGFFAVFALGGIAAFFGTVVLPVMHLVAARSWVAVPCSITSSSVQSQSSSDGTSYWAEIHYTFQLDGNWYEGDRHNFSSGSGGEGSAQKWVRRYPVGDETTCWADPDDPHESVIDRRPGWFLLWGLFPIPFLAIGFGGIWFLARQPEEARKAEALKTGTRGRRTPARRSTRPSAGIAAEPSPGAGSTSRWTRTATASSAPSAPSALYGGSSSHSGAVSSQISSPFDPSPPGSSAAETALEPMSEPRLTALADPAAYPPDANGRLVLEPTTSAGAKAVGMLIFSLIWNAFVGFLILPAMVENFDDGAFGVVVAGFLSILALVGLGTIGGVVYFFLGMFNPVPRLVLERSRPCLGDRCRVAWTLAGRVDRIESLTLKLEARERATYRRGTNTVTERHTLYEQELVRLDRFIDVRGSTEFEIPETAMPTFTARNNEVEWRLVIHGDIPRWPDVKEEMLIPVFPPGLGDQDYARSESWAD